MGGQTLQKKYKKPGKDVMGPRLVTCIAKLCKKKKPGQKNRDLITVLRYSGIEDIHSENFIVDDKDQLHFIDSEIFQTNTVSNIRSSYEAVKHLIDGEREAKAKPHIEELCKQLQSISTRLVICATAMYAFVGRRPTSFTFQSESFICDFKDIQFMNMVEFLHSKGLTSLPRKSEVFNFEKIIDSLVDKKFISFVEKSELLQKSKEKKLFSAKEIILFLNENNNLFIKKNTSLEDSVQSVCTQQLLNCAKEHVNRFCSQSLSDLYSLLSEELEEVDKIGDTASEEMYGFEIPAFYFSFSEKLIKFPLINKVVKFSKEEE